ncbi:MAG TPA: thioredoxin family protein [Terrimicrobiaceae bacterium]
MTIHPSRESLENHQIVTSERWLAARKELLKREKELTRLRDEVSARRRELPWVRVEKNYIFQGPHGPETLADLFKSRSQLFVQHFMLGPDWDEGCVGCAFWADHHDAANLHLAHHDVSLVAVSRGTWWDIERFKTRMGWHFRWVSSHENDFNYDFQVSFTEAQIVRGEVVYNYERLDEGAGCEELAGFSVFYRSEIGEIFHTYSGYARAGDILIGAYNYLDHTPKGRNERQSMDWVRHHDCYGRESSAPTDRIGSLLSA